MVEEEIDFAQQLEDLLDEHDYELPQAGDIRQGIIVAISQQGVIVDLGVKRDGLVPPSDLNKLEPEEREKLQINDEIDVYIVDTEQPDGLGVSIYRARLNQDWIEAERMMESGEVFEGAVEGYNRGGIIVPFGNLRGFVPASHLIELRRGLDDRQRQQIMAKMRDEKIPLKVIEVDRRRRRLVFSQRDAQKEWQEVRKERLIDKLNEGDTIKGRVSGLRNFGAFIDLGGADGLVHISELAWHRVNHPKEVVKVGDEMEVYVLSLDRDEQRIALSRKALLPNPWSLVKENYREGQLVEGAVTRLVNYGAFVEIEPGVEGLLHTSQLSYGPIDNPEDLIKEGEVHLLRIVSIDSERQRIGLSLKGVTANEQIEWMAKREQPAEPKKGKKAAAVEVEEVTAEIEEAAVEEVTAEIEEVAVEEVTAEVEEAAVEEVTAEVEEVAVEEVTAEVEDTAVAEVTAEVEEAAEVEEVTAEVEEAVEADQEVTAEAEETAEVEETAVAEVTAEDEEAAEADEEEAEIEVEVEAAPAEEETAEAEETNEEPAAE
jgi:small subunit ribosomal protein S1